VTCARAEAGLSYLSEMEGEAPHATNNPKATWRFMEIWQEVGGRRPELSGRDSTCYTKTDGSETRVTKRALVTGILGQDGAYLAKLLLEEGYEVYGGFRRSASMNNWRLEELGITDDVKMISFELLEFTNILRVVEKIRPDEFYNLAAQSFVGASFEQPIITSDIDAMGVARILEVLRTAQPECRFYQASTSEMYGKVQAVPQSERTPFYPRSPYAVAKLYAHWMTINYRESYGLRTSSGILFNHESPLRGIEFVTRKITDGLARVHRGLQEVVELGNMDAKRDWGFAGDYVKGMWLMLQQAESDDYVLATGKNHSVRDFVGRAAEAIGFDLEWDGEAEDTTAIDRKSGKAIVRVNPEFYRPAEVETLLGDPTKAREKLGWEPEVEFDQLVEMMAKADVDRVAAQ
jgi:GDPmannose 4,6-dehydratase